MKVPLLQRILTDTHFWVPATVLIGGFTLLFLVQ